MRHFYNAIIGICSVLFLWGSFEAAGAEQSVKTRIDSTVVELDNGDVVVKYSVKPFDFGALHHPDPSQRRSLVLSEEEKNQRFDTFRASQEATVSVRKSPRRASVQADYSDYAVGEIPIEAWYLANRSENLPDSYCDSSRIQIDSVNSPWVQQPGWRRLGRLRMGYSRIVNHQLDQ